MRANPPPIERRWFVHDNPERMLPLEQLLKIRGVDNHARFLTPPFPDPEEIGTQVGLINENLTSALVLIDQAILSNAPIVIHGDFDVDGVCATAIVWEAIYHGRNYKNVFPFIPNRFEHGYGLSQQSVGAILAAHQDPLIITVDCGITAVESIQYLNNWGIKTILTDHHTPAENFPQPSVLLHTTRLSGSGIAWVLASLLGYSQPTIDLAALGTIADIHPLTGASRDIVWHGLRLLETNSRIGIKALREVAGVASRKLTPGVIGWWIAPRLNAAGRLESAFDSLRLLSTRNEGKAYERAENLNNINTQRQELTEEALEGARGQLNSDLVQIVESPTWNEGILGLVAGRLKEDLYRPVIALTDSNEDSLKGSARSIEGFDITSALRNSARLIKDVGGHPMAAGLSLLKGNLPILREEINLLASQQLTSDQLKPKIICDYELKLTDASVDLVKQIAQLEPFGVGNSTPVFLIKDCSVVKAVPFGKEAEHLKIKINQAGVDGEAVWFRAPKVDWSGFYNFAVELEIDSYWGDERVRLMVKDACPATTTIAVLSQLP